MPSRFSGYRKSVNGFRLYNRAYLTGPKRSGTLTSQVRSLQNYIKKLSPEVKYNDIPIDATNLPSTGSVVHLSQIGQGDTAVSRTGNAIYVTSVRYGVQVLKSNDSPSVDSASVIRFAVVVDKQQVGDTLPSAGDIFQSADPLPALPTIINLDRFRVLWMSDPMSLARMNLDTDDQLVPTLNNWIEGTVAVNSKVYFNGANSSDIQKNGVYWVTLTDDSAATMDTVGTCRIAFSDA